MAKQVVTVDLREGTQESKITFRGTRELFGWLVRNKGAKLGADTNGNWFIKVKAQSVKD